MSTSKLLVIYVCLSAVYLLYLPHALPVLDDWTYLQRFSQARAGGLSAEAALLADLVSNRLLGQFRIFWAGFVPVVAVSLAAGFTAWPYYLLAVISHLLTAVLLARTVTMLAADDNAGFLAGAIYAVLPAANGSLFWPVATSFYFTQALVFSAWFYATWKKLAIREDFRFGIKEFLFLALTAFTGEQILPALMGLLPVSFWLFGKREHRGRAMRYSIVQLAVLVALLGAYALVLNRVPIRGGIESRYPGGARWSPWPVVVRLLAALGLRPGFAEWTPAWQLDLALGLLLALAGAAFWWAFLGESRANAGWPRPVTGARPVSATPAARLLAWSAAGAALTYLPVARLPGIEWRYHYVPAAFLSAGVAAALGFLPRPARAALAFVAVAYSISLTYFEMRQCWIPQSREAQVILSTVEAAKPLRPGEVLIFAHAPHAMGTAPAFIAGASWSMNSMLEHYAGDARVQGARELLVNEQGDLALYRRDSLAPFNHADIGKLRVFVRGETGGYSSKSIVALPAAAGNFQLFPLRPEIECPRQPLAMDELKRLPLYSDIYFAHAVKTDLPVRGETPHA